VSEARRRQQEWEARYVAGRTGWDRGDVSPALRYWLERDEIPAGRILVPGCGHGHEIAALAASGRYVTAVDIAAQPVLRLMGALADAGLHANVVQADLLHWTPAEPFDAVYEQTCICALEPDTWQDYVNRLANWLVPGGKLFALFMQTAQPGGPPYDCPVPAMRDLFDPADWEWPAGEAMEVPHPNGFVEHGFVLVRRR